MIIHDHVYICASEIFGSCNSHELLMSLPSCNNSYCSHNCDYGVDGGMVWYVNHQNLVLMGIWCNAGS